jgi:inosine-uridine nucleoside N-ribohydrolase
MQFPGRGRPSVGIVFDCDMGNSIDDVLALAMLYVYDNKGDIRVVSVSTSKPNLKSAAFCEVMGQFYSGAVSGAFGGRGRTLPVGMAVKSKMEDDTPMLLAPLGRKTGDGKPLYNHGIEKLTDTAETPALIRNALTAQYDQNAIVVLTGPATNLAQVLDLPGVKELIRAKVKFLSAMGGAYPSGEPEFNIKADIPAAKKLFAEWPTPIVASGFEVGEKLLFPAASIEKDFAWTPNHPVVDAYRAYDKMPYDTPAWDMTAVLHGVKPDDGFFKLSDPGRIEVLDDGRTKFTPAPDGHHRYLILDPAQKDKIVTTFTQVASTKPEPRQFRFRRPVEQQEGQKKALPPKPPAEAKQPTP